MTRRLALLAWLGTVACEETPAPTPFAEGGNASFAGEATSAAGQPLSSGGSGEPSGGGSSHDGGDQRPSGAGAGGGAGSGGDGCDLASLEELDVFSPSWDPLGYPPYAIDGCNVVYVAAEAGGGALYHVELTTGVRTLLDAAEQHPRRPTIAGDVIAWERDGAGAQSSVRVRTSAGERTFADSGEPRAAADAVVYTRFLGPAASDDTDVFLYRPDDDDEAPIAQGAGQQRFADVSVTHVAVTDFSEDPSGAFDTTSSIADIVVVDRETGEATSRARPGKQAFPLLGKDGALVYLEWGAVHPEPKFSQFFLKAGRLSEPTDRDVNLKGEDPVVTDVAYVRPSLHGTRVDFVDRSSDARLYSVDVSGDAAPVMVAEIAETQLLGPASSELVTLVATPVSGRSLRLVAVSR